jgi:hypothetical protein
MFVPVTKTQDMLELNTKLEQLQIASSKLIARLADRAAYAKGEEYEEIRALMTALRQLGGSPAR